MFWPIYVYVIASLRKQGSAGFVSRRRLPPTSAPRVAEQPRKRGLIEGGGIAPRPRGGPMLTGAAKHEYRGPRTRPFLTWGTAAAASRSLNQTEHAPDHGGNWWTAKFC